MLLLTGDAGPYGVPIRYLVGKAFMPSVKSAFGGRTQFAPTVQFHYYLAFPGGRLSHGVGGMPAKQTERDGLYNEVLFLFSLPQQGRWHCEVMTDEENTDTNGRKRYNTVGLRNPSVTCGDTHLPWRSPLSLRDISPFYGELPFIQGWLSGGQWPPLRQTFRSEL